ncbi:hypothetical protein KC340_g164 [Hortaea werneckii]|nr:hypothetical protein KC340_g164 [Hortaea werneckii]
MWTSVVYQNSRRGQCEGSSEDLYREDEGNVKPDPRPGSWSRWRRSGGYDAEDARREVVVPKRKLRGG